MKRLFLILVVVSSLLNAQRKEYCSPMMINMEIEATLKEHNRQVDMRKGQVKQTVLEKYNNNEWNKLKKVSTKIQERLRFVDFALQGIPTGYKLYLEFKDIKEIEQEIIKEIEDTPYAAIVALKDQIEFADQVQMISRFLIGIVSSYGAINQMEKAERQILLNHALNEVWNLKSSAYNTLFLVRDFKKTVRFKAFSIKYYVNRDIQIVKDIMKDIKDF
ncbi:hypothetical protein IMZ16_04060 [Cruoricaptor ignavus]|uniref:Uncharacterized protein n=1 Tax=Cruoricaptor ignavus TaxID=1118202 RepID=A0A7M1T5P3_9FLAO|nr:hypothetical protein [Cruoricaptor ignavus]QOR74617.1 hypothetical protein IMZ16_04060 [Cruoricaptor ignavus]